MLGDDTGVGVGLAALGGEAGESVGVETAGEGDAGNDGDAEESEPPRRDKAHHEPRQER